MAGEGRGARRGAAARLLRLCVNEASALSSRTRRASTCERHNACVQVVMEGFLSWRNVTCDCTLEACRTQYYWRVLPVSLWQSMGKKNGGLQHLCVYRC